MIAMSEAIKKLWNFIRDLFGFRINSKYVKNYLNDANVKSSIYMSSIIIILEIWMIVRQTKKYIIPALTNSDSSIWQVVSNPVHLVFYYVSLYLLFIMCATSMLVFAINHMKKKQSDKGMTVNIIFGIICVLWTILLIPENKTGSTVNVVTTIALYCSMPIFGLSIIGYSLYRKKYEKKSTALSVIVISCFALVCLVFGVKVGYSDFAHSPTLNKDGTINIEKIKMITCFLTMVIFVACLLIWKPYISILLLTSVFVGFLYLLKSYPGRTLIEADEINYNTFLISLTMISIAIYQQRIAEAKKDEELIHDAVYDHSIDVHNIRYFSKKITTDVDTLEDKIYLFIDLTNFKIINEQYGFEAGDQFLKNFATDVQEAFKGDLVARQSDDHFVVLTSVSDFQEKIDNLEQDVNKLANGLFINLKVGGYRPLNDDSPERAIDKARYAANMIKKKYGVKYLEYDAELNERFTKRQYIVNHIDEAIEKGYIVPYYQPVVWSKNEQLCGAEALARWVDPIYGFLSPAEFIPVLEETRLIHKLDAGIVEAVCRNMAKARQQKKPIVPVSVNFSRLDFDLMDVEKVLDTNLEKYGIEKEFIHVEVTESALADDTDFLNTVIANLKKKGYAIWLDDFGSGYSSLNVLKDFNFDVIKIDMKFLTNFDTNKKSRDVLDCIIQLANKLGMKTLSEGVETKEEADFLESIGCGRLQGYLFGKPYPLKEFEKKINKGELKVAKKIL